MIENESRKRETEGIQLILSNTKIIGECVDDKNVRDPENDQRNFEVLNFT